MDEEVIFTCKTCGSHDLKVTHEFDVSNGSYTEHWREWGPLDDDHHFSYDDREKMSNSVDNDVENQTRVN